MPFGKYKGYRVSSVFQYDPKYIEWAISTRKYCFNIPQLNALPRSTPFRKLDSVELVPGYATVDLIPTTNPNYIEEAIEFQEQGGIIEEHKHTFTADTINSNDRMAGI